MKKVIITNVIVLLLSLTAMAQDKKVAVFDPAGSVDMSVKEIVREEISSIVVNTVGYTVLERQLIEKVLEENKFQMGGLVDNSEISEIGKRMGADFVFVSNITIIDGKNFHISCKMIDVLTARIEMQKTGQASKKTSELIIAVQKMVKEMFSNTQKTSQTNKPIVEEKPSQTNTPIVEEKPSQANKPIVEEKSEKSTEKLDKKGKKVFMNGRELGKAEVRRIMADTDIKIYENYKGITLNKDVLSVYNKGIRKNNVGTGLVIAGPCLIFVGILIFDSSGFHIWDKEDAGGPSMMVIGTACLTTGIVLKSSGKKDIRRAVNAYNNGGGISNMELKFGFTGNGIGFALNF
jgi:hypothetical protein